MPKDGDCLFRSLVRQLHRQTKRKTEQELDQVREHLPSLGFCGNEDQDVSRLRHLFVQERTENMDEYTSWISNTCDLAEITRFKNNGYFASEVGDLCIRACACTNILQIPVVVVTALPNVSNIPFLPTKVCTGDPLYIAFDHSGPGHCDSTKGIYITDLASIHI